MAIVSQSIVLNAAQADGRRDIKYRFTDHLGKVHDTPVRRVPSAFDANADMLAMVPLIEARLARKEVADYLHILRNGKNPLRDESNNPVDPEHQTRGQVIKRILSYIGNLEPDQALEYKQAYTFLSNLTQSQVESLGYTWAQYQNWQTKIQALRDAAIASVKLG